MKHSCTTTIITAWLEGAIPLSTPGGYVVKWCKEECYKDPVSGGSIIRDENAQQIINLLSSSHMPILVKPAMGIDGCTIEVSVGNDWGSVHYSWWVQVPEGWEPLGKVVQILLDHVPSEVILDQ